MSIQAVFNGVTYSLPEKGEVGWFDLTDYLYALSGAATTSAMTYSVTNVTTSSYNVTTTDMTLLVNYAGDCTINLPVGTEGRFLCIIDKSGVIADNDYNIILDGSSTQTINSNLTYYLNSNKAAILLQFDSNSSDWKIVSELKYLDEVDEVLDNGTLTITFNYKMHNLMFMDENGVFINTVSDYAGATFTCLTDRSNYFLQSDSGVGYYFSKSATSNTITVKNRTGGTRILAYRRL